MHSHNSRWALALNTIALWSREVLQFGCDSFRDSSPWTPTAGYWETFRRSQREHHNSINTHCGRITTHTHMHGPICWSTFGQTHLRTAAKPPARNSKPYVWIMDRVLAGSGENIDGALKSHRRLRCAAMWTCECVCGHDTMTYVTRVALLKETRSAAALSNVPANKGGWHRDDAQTLSFAQP